MLLCILALLTTRTVGQTRPVSHDNILEFSQGEPKAVALGTGNNPYLFVALSFYGVVAIAGDGNITDRILFDNPLSEATSVTVTDTLTPGVSLVAIADEAAARIAIRHFDTNKGRFLMSGNDVDAGIDISAVHTPTHLCFAHDPYDAGLYLFSGGDHGVLDQYRLWYTADKKLHSGHVRSITIGGETSDCVSNSANGMLYVIEPMTGVWQLAIDPETDPIRTLFAATTPHGEMEEPVSITLLTDKDALVPVISDDNVLYTLADDATIRNRLEYRPPGDTSLENISAGRYMLDGIMADVLALAIESDNGGGLVQLLATGTLGNVPYVIDPTQQTTLPVLYPSLETDPVPHAGDAADDPAIWVHPHDPARSLILGTDKNGGLAVYDLAGHLMQYIPDGRLNNIDIRTGFEGMSGLEYIAAATDRTHTAIALYAIDADTQQLRRVNARQIPAEFYDPYGLCMYRSQVNNELYVIASNATGQIHQWRLFPTANNTVDAELVRQLSLDSVAEGCVVDDETGYLYIAEEDVAIWRFGAEPDAGNERIAITRVSPDGEVVDDIEGIALFTQPGGKGYLVVSSQGSDSYAIYERQPPHRFRGIFRVRANIAWGIDGVSETDGLDVNSTPLPGYPAGLMVLQDGRNIEPAENQNFKYVSWQSVIDALGLDE